jgi:glycosyltransferase A (GT-A) superfamily protein (DUF2064 family)
MKKELLIFFSGLSEPDSIIREIIINTENISVQKFYFYEKAGSYTTNKDFEHCYRPIGYDRTEKIMNAFLKGFLNNYSPILLIHCSKDFTSIKNYQNCFSKLNSNDLIYSVDSEERISMIGMKRFIPSVFQNKLELSAILKLIAEKTISGEVIRDEDFFEREINYSNG